MAARVAITAAASRAGEEIAPLEGFDASGFGAPKGSQIWKTPEEPEDDPAMRILGPHGRLFDELAREVHEAAGLASFPRDRVGLFVGMGMVDSPVGDLLPAAVAARDDGAVDWAAFYGGAYRMIHPLWPLSMLNNVGVGQVSIDLDIRGDNVVLASDADAGLRALLEAVRAVRAGACDAAISGGVSGRITPAALARMRLQGRGDLPLGEGGGAFVFEREPDAGARGAPVLGFVCGGATAFDAEAPEAAVERAVRSALADAGVDGADVFFVLGDDGTRNGRAGVTAAGVTTAAPGGARAHLGAGSAAANLFAALHLLAQPELHPWADQLDTRHGLVLAGGAEGGVGALVVEAA